MKVTTKGQVTIPLHVRKELGIEPHSEVDFVKTEDGGYRLMKVQAKKPESRFARLRGIATLKMTTDEILALTRGENG
jgi:antitoxin PrlF